jgi:PAS domain S-box-containing protein
MHRLLKRQIRKYLSAEDELRLKDFLDAVDQAYQGFDADHDQLETILEQSSQELFKLNSELQKALLVRTEEVKTASSRLESVVSNITEIIFQANKEGDWDYLNPAWQRITGFSVEGSLDSNIFEFIHPEDGERCKSKFFKLVNGELDECISEVRFVTANGSYKWCELIARYSEGEDGNINGLSGSIKDISDKKNIEQEKKLTEEKFKLIFEKSSLAYLVICESRFLECNKACLDLFGVSDRRDFLGRFVKDFSPEFQPNGLRSDEQAREMIRIAQVSGFNRFDWMHKKENGDEFPVEVALNSVPLMDGNVLFVVLTDLSQRKRVENELIVAKEKAEEATRAKAQFLSTMSHEIRTPMNAVIGVTHLLSENDPREDQISNLNILKLSADNLMALINDILDFSKIEAGKIVLENIDFNFRNLVKNVGAGFQMKSEEKGLDFIIEIDPKIPKYMIGDPTRISQVINNLCGNAIKFTEDGFVRIRVNYKGTENNRVKLQFEITDTGIGIPSHMQNRIFDSFSQADSNTTRLYGGTGLGLTITSKLIEIMNGKIHVKSELEKGTTFFIDLDFAVSMKSKSRVSYNTEYFQNTSKIEGLHVLVAEDNPMNVLIIKQFLKKWNVTYEIANNGLVALEKVQENHFDMVLMDLQMPVMDGYQAARDIRKLGSEKYRSMPIIAFTASAFNEIRSKVIAAGMNDFVTKPINPEELYVKLEKYLP